MKLASVVLFNVEISVVFVAILVALVVIFEAFVEMFVTLVVISLSLLAISVSFELILVLLVLMLDSTSVKSPSANVPEIVASSLKVAAPETAKVLESVVAPVTSRVPAIEVFPDDEATVNLLVLISKSPSIPVAPVTSSVLAIVVAPARTAAKVV